jgi:hypothetical protein
VGFWRRGWFLLKPIKGKLLNNPGYPIHVRPFDNSRTLSSLSGEAGGSASWPSLIARGLIPLVVIPHTLPYNELWNFHIVEEHHG